MRKRCNACFWTDGGIPLSCRKKQGHKGSHSTIMNWEDGDPSTDEAT